MPKASIEEIRALALKYHKTKKPAIREELILKSIFLVNYVARPFAGKGEDRETLYSVGTIALVRAADRFDPAQGASFDTYARKVIEGEIKKHFRDKTWEVSVERSLKDDYLKVRREVDRLTQELKRSPRVPEVAQRCALSEERVLEALELGPGSRGISLESPFRETDSGETVELKSHIAADGPVEKEIIEAMSLKGAMAQLSPRERLIVSLYHGHEMSQEEIAERLGLSQVQVSRALKEAMMSLRKILD